MKVLHIACGFSYSSVYKNLFKEFSNSKLNIEVYVPQHDNKSTPKIMNEDYPYRLYSNKLIKSFDKILYFSKIWRMTKDVEENFDLANVSILHAHSLFSDGGVAYELYKKYNIPYIVAIRNTDINKYYKYAIHLRKYALKILLNSDKIVFLSCPYRDVVINKYVPAIYQKEIRNKSHVIPNGINYFWLKNINKGKKTFYKTNSQKIRLILVGSINKNKNALTVIKACELLRTRHGVAVDFLLVGKIDDKAYFQELKKYSYVEHVGYQDKRTLLNLYRDNDIYIMPSIHETFGLVYAEAMSQGLPVIYSSGQGFDKHFEDGVVGYSVDANNEEDIANKIMRIVERYDDISNNCISFVNKFSWNEIGREYKNMYEETNE